jgi:hypothetical protein
MPTPTTNPNELAAPLHPRLGGATPALAARMMANAKGLAPLGPAPGSYVLEN